MYDATISSNIDFLPPYSVSGVCAVIDTNTDPAPPVAPVAKLKMVRKCVFHYCRNKEETNVQYSYWEWMDVEVNHGIVSFIFSTHLKYLETAETKRINEKLTQRNAKQQK